MTKIKILSGLNSIGGNFVRIEDNDRVIVFDQGIRFDIMAKYYSSYITPKSVTELRKLEILPKLEWYDNVDRIYISHMHLDHLGALSNIPPETELFLPNLLLYNTMEKRWQTSQTWLSLIPQKYHLKIGEIQPYKVDENDVLAIPVSHSAWPAYAFLYFGKDETILYTGDFRDESFLSEDEFFKINRGADLLNYLEENKDVRIDTLIIEGTNIGSSKPPITPNDTVKLLRRLFISHRSIIAILHSLDLEYAYTLIRLAEEFDLRCYVISDQIAKLLKSVIANVSEFIELSNIELSNIDNNDIDNSLILIQYRDVFELLRNSNFNVPNTPNLTAILAESEPGKEEGSEYSIISNWFLKYGIQYYKIRSSGHYYPYALKYILQKIRAKNIIPIHCENLKLLINQIKIYRYKK